MILASSDSSGLILATVAGPVIAAFCVWLGRASMGVGKAKRAERAAEREHQAKRDQAHKDLADKVLEITYVLSGHPKTMFDPPTSGIIEELRAVTEQVTQNAKHSEEMFQRVATRLDAGDKRMNEIEKRLP